MKRKRVPTKDMSGLEIQRQFGVSRTTAWRAQSRGWVYVNYHEKEIIPDEIWANVHISEILESAAKGVWSYLRRRAAKAARTISELCAPFDPEDVIQQATLRLVELSGHPEREREGWRVVVAQHAAADFVDAILIRTRNSFSLYTGEQGTTWASTEDHIELAKVSFQDLVPEDVLEAAAKVVSGKRPKKKELELLRQFREKWGWMVQ